MKKKNSWYKTTAMPRLKWAVLGYGLLALSMFAPLSGSYHACVERNSQRYSHALERLRAGLPIDKTKDLEHIESCQAELEGANTLEAIRIGLYFVVAVLLGTRFHNAAVKVLVFPFQWVRKRLSQP
ncbi:hypothetical protein PQU94_08995 [Asticcacaulis sp. DXS10W]|uniref:Uncharacterized protein n=1 Tax=Asticcacaulis currens TaxID=2984210 RepID=A0ABT5IE01_9CAUL|nr:hypothetical protein [Asticcacaulis currens]MDC7694416.1 hypothetical protein [Asticcacaulis currens]